MIPSDCVCQKPYWRGPLHCSRCGLHHPEPWSHTKGNRMCTQCHDRFRGPAGAQFCPDCTARLEALMNAAADAGDLFSRVARAMETGNANPRLGR